MIGMTVVWLSVFVDSVYTLYKKCLDCASYLSYSFCNDIYTYIVCTLRHPFPGPDHESIFVRGGLEA